LGGGNFDVNIFTVDPDGSNQASYASFLGNSYPVAAPNPNAATAATAVAFAYLDPSSSTYDIYTNSSVTITGAKRITTGNYLAIGTMQFSPDGTKVAFIGTTNNGNFLFNVNADGSNTPRNVDSADDFYLGGDNQTVCYTKDDASFNGQIWLGNIDGVNIHQLTNDAFDHFGPQLSKDLSHITYSASENGASGGYDVFTSAVDGTQLIQATNTGADEALTPSFNNNGTQVAYVFLSSSNVALSGVYYVGINGLGTTQIVQDSAVNTGLYWTSSLGILSKGGKSAPFGHSLHITYLKKHGKWHH
jgi:Tol biopolymer transport system component